MCDHDRIGNVCWKCDDDDTAYCADSCGRVATAERFVGIMTGPELVEVVELVCVYCLRATEVDTPLGLM